MTGPSIALRAIRRPGLQPVIGLLMLNDCATLATSWDWRIHDLTSVPGTNPGLHTIESLGSPFHSGACSSGTPKSHDPSHVRRSFPLNHGLCEESNHPKSSSHESQFSHGQVLDQSHSGFTIHGPVMLKQDTVVQTPSIIHWTAESPTHPIAIPCRIATTSAFRPSSVLQNPFLSFMAGCPSSSAKHPFVANAYYLLRQ